MVEHLCEMNEGRRVGLVVTLRCGGVPLVVEWAEALAEETFSFKLTTCCVVCTAACLLVLRVILQFCECSVFPLNVLGAYM